jgi:hypothetical protein
VRRGELESRDLMMMPGDGDGDGDGEGLSDDRSGMQVPGVPAG